MAWTAGVTRTTGDLISAADWNNYLGAIGSVNYLKAQTDTIDAMTMSMPSRSLDTVYHNGSKIRFVAVTIRLDSLLDSCAFKIGNADPPVNQLGYTRINDGSDITTLNTFAVPPDYYYEAETVSGSPTKLDWHEWDAHT